MVFVINMNEPSIKQSICGWFSDAMTLMWQDYGENASFDVHVKYILYVFFKYNVSYKHQICKTTFLHFVFDMIWYFAEVFEL